MRSADLSLLPCHSCGLVCRKQPHTEKRLYCPRCGSRLHHRKPKSQSRTLAYLIAAIILYIPANVMPIMYTQKLSSVQSHTILGGVVQLWNGGAMDLAIIVFTASILVPVTKLVVLSYLLFTIRRGSAQNHLRNTRLYRAVERIGRWSMLDLYVVTLLTSLVSFHTLANIRAGFGIFAFAAVVVLTMLASMSFDPRLIWDRNKTNE